MSPAPTICTTPANYRGRCDQHKRQADQARGTAHQRGYNYRHQQERRRWTPQVQAGRVTCAKCGTPIAPAQPWDHGHTEDRTAWTGPECLPCNRGHRRGLLPCNTGPSPWGVNPKRS